MKPLYSLVIPVYNSSESLHELVDRVDAVFTQKIKSPYEIIMVDDCSPNAKTWMVLQELSGKYPAVRAIQLMRNFGQTAALLCGMNAAKGEYVITMDDDLQHRPEDIPMLIEEQDHDVVIGSFPEKQHSWSVKITSQIKSWFDHVIIGKPKHIQLSPFRLMKSEVVKAIQTIRTPYPFLPAMMFYVTKDVVSVDVTHDHRKYGASNYNFFKRMALFLRLIINNSSLLLRMVASIGLILSCLSFLGGIWYVFKTLIVGSSVPGWTSLMVVLLLTGGLILLSLGVIGEYLVRIVNGIEQRPAYIIRETKK